MEFNRETVLFELICLLIMFSWGYILGSFNPSLIDWLLNMCGLLSGMIVGVLIIDWLSRRRR